MREARIAMRTVDAIWDGRDVADDDLKRTADAADQIVSRRQKRMAERRAAIAWLKAKRQEMGLGGVAKLLNADVANLGKMIDGKRKFSDALASKIRYLSAASLE
jgi:hypothetical protein